MTAVYVIVLVLLLLAGIPLAAAYAVAHLLGGTSGDHHEPDPLDVGLALLAPDDPRLPEES